jgi:hypothetical protein
VTQDVVEFKLADDVGIGETFSIDYPDGRSAAHYVPTVGHYVITNTYGVFGTDNGKASFSFGVSAITITNLSPVAWALETEGYINLDLPDLPGVDLDALAAVVAAMVSTQLADVLRVHSELTEDWQSGAVDNNGIVAIGDEKVAPNLTNESAGSVIAIGSGSLFKATSANRVIAMGTGAVANTLTPGFGTIGIGDFSLANVTGTRNLGFGTLAGHFLTTGSHNTLISRDAGQCIVEGVDNVGAGYRSMACGWAPVGLSGAIENQYPTGSGLTANAGYGNYTLQWVAEYGNTAMGDRAGSKIRAGHGNTYHGALAGLNHGELVSENDKVLDQTVRTGTFSQTGTTITVTVTDHGAVVGNKVNIKFTATDFPTEYQWLSVLAVTNANVFTITSPVSVSASGTVSINIVETAVSREAGDYNTMCGYRSGHRFAHGSNNLLLGPWSGSLSGWGSNSFDDKLVIQCGDEVKPLIGGDFATGRVSINAGIDDLDHTFSVYNAASGALLFSVRTDTGAAHVGEFAADGATAGKRTSANVIESSSTGTGSADHIIFYNGNGNVGKVNTNGPTTSFVTTCDERRKKNFTDFDAGPIIDAIEVFKFEWIEGGTIGYGPKAQALAEIFPQAVSEGSAVGPGEEGFVSWGYDASKLVPLLIREVQALRARVAALENP